MEKTISIEDRIRRAEEIYNRRRGEASTRANIRYSNINKNEKIKLTLFKKMALQVAICFVICLIMHLIKNTNYIFSESVINKTKEFLSYDINFNSVYNSIVLYYDNKIKPILEQKDVDEIVEDNEGENATEQKQEDGKENEQEKDTVENTENSNQNKLDGIGGGEDENLKVEDESKKESADVLNEKEENSTTEETSAAPIEAKEEVQLSQMEIDANDIKANYSLILPLVGTISSRYGPRTPTSIVSANHAGIDIAVNEGTVFVAAMEGKVITASSYGSYGNHIFIQNGDVITVYAHCKTLYVKEGDFVQQGQKLGEVGQTGNATGPHLHFEIRKDGRTVNPEYILKFG